MACSSCWSFVVRGLPRSPRQSTPTISPVAPSRRTRVQSVHSKSKAKSRPTRSVAGAETIASECSDKDSPTAWLKRRKNEISGWGWLVADHNTSVSRIEFCLTTKAAPRAPIISAARATKLLANSGSWRSGFSSRARPINDSARRRCCSERSRLRVTSRTTAACAAKAWARRISS